MDFWRSIIQKIVSERTVVGAPLAIRPLNANVGAFGYAEAYVNKPGVAGRMSAADLHGSAARGVAGFDRDFGTDSVSVDAALQKCNLEPVTHWSRAIVTTDCTAVLKQTDIVVAIDDDDIELPVQIQIDH